MGGRKNRGGVELSRKLDALEDEYISHSATADTMPKAVALAAYKALAGEEWTDGQ